MKKYNIAVIGVGVVGIEILKILKQRNFPINNLKVFARSARQISVGQDIYDVEAIGESEFNNIDIALFAGTEGEKGASVLYADKFIEKGAVVIDNGNDFRLKDDVPLVVPEVNANKIPLHKGLIANPNCTTIQAVTALGSIHKSFGLNQIILTSFQATSGAGKAAENNLWKEAVSLTESNSGIIDASLLNKRVDNQRNQIIFNLNPQIGEIAKAGYTTEEWKVVNETHKILDDSLIKISATCVRVPVFTSHSEAIYFTTKKDVTLDNLESALTQAQGVKYLRNDLCFPLDAEGKDEVFISRLRPDPFSKNSFWLWCVADNLRKGAALNAVQIAENLVK